MLLGLYIKARQYLLTAAVVFMGLLVPITSVVGLLAGQWKLKQSAKTTSACNTHWM